MSRGWFAIYNSKTEKYMEVAVSDVHGWVKILWTDIDKNAYIMLDSIWNDIEKFYLGIVGMGNPTHMTSKKQSNRNDAVSIWMSEECNRARGHMFLVPCTDVDVNPIQKTFTPDFENADRLF